MIRILTSVLFGQVQEQTGRTDCPVCEVDWNNCGVSEDVSSIVHKSIKLVQSTLSLFTANSANQPVVVMRKKFAHNRQNSHATIRHRRTSVILRVRRAMSALNVWMWIVFVELVSYCQLSVLCLGAHVDWCDPNSVRSSFHRSNEFKP